MEEYAGVTQGWLIHSFRVCGLSADDQDHPCPSWTYQQWHHYEFPPRLVFARSNGHRAARCKSQSIWHVEFAWEVWMVNGPCRKRAFQLIDSNGNIGETGKEEYTVASLANSAGLRFLEALCLAQCLAYCKGVYLPQILSSALQATLTAKRNN